MKKRMSFADAVVIAFILGIGATELLHIFGLYKHTMEQFILAPAYVMSFSIVLIPLGALVLRKWSPIGREVLPVILWIAVLCSQILFILWRNPVDRETDAVAEMVQTILQGGEYGNVNPFTGRAYEVGVPSRIQILCLPALYASFIRLTGLDTVFFLRRIVPVVILLISYAAFYSMGHALFGDNKHRISVYLLIVALILWVGSYGRGMDGFEMLCAGWKPTTVRNLILVPFTFSLCLRKRYAGILLCVLAEACICWTLYGVGVCLVSGALLGGMSLLVKWKERQGGD